MTVIDDYLAKIDAPQRAELERIRKIVKTTVPEVKEVISYGMPGFKYKDKYLIAFSAFKDHLSLFPTSRPVEELESKLSKYKLSKGTIQFTLDNPIPESLIKEILLVRINDIDK
jgi:uncharacterized protein YdhG (YjbR/CyaY superfamily)